MLVAGGFHRNGGMDRLNLALADYLADRGRSVHLVCYSFNPELENKVTSIKLVQRPRGSFRLGGLLLAREGRRVAGLLQRGSCGARVVVNGGNCDWPDINWVHCVHHAWKRSGQPSRSSFRLRDKLSRWLFCRRERIVLGKAQVLIANSQRTRKDLENLLQIDPERIHVVYPGADTDFRQTSMRRREAALAWLGRNERRPLVAFVGAFGEDSNKGFNVLFSAWVKLCDRRDWDVDLVVAGGGRALESWRHRVVTAGLDRRITMLGFTNRVPDVLAAADLLVSPVRYESYGLNVHEALCTGIPAMVTKTAGVAERYPTALGDLLLNDPDDADDLAARIFRWRTAIPYWKENVTPLARELSCHTLTDMAGRIVAIADGMN
ncbi:MAG: glycosyltransferase family 4 protein [Deltaproteobacteria bacterium]|nr:glycosyltransferase family 4 protein [Deltaproteobacteria bacterium]